VFPEELVEFLVLQVLYFGFSKSHFGSLLTENPLTCQL
jgi:hypothetical protein